MADKSSASNGNSNKSRHKNQPNPRHNHYKRPPQKPENNENTIYVSTKSSIKALKERCSKLIVDKQEVVIYCLGAAIQRGILLALQLQEENADYNVDTNTLTTELIDDLEPAVDDEDYEIQRRHNSALRIRLFRNNAVLDLQESPACSS